MTFYINTYKIRTIFSNDQNHFEQSNFVRLTVVYHLSCWIHFQILLILTLSCTTPDALHQRHRGIYKHFAHEQPNISNSCSSESWLLRLHFDVYFPSCVAEDVRLSKAKRQDAVELVFTPVSH